MNALNLRISSIKTGENLKKNSEIRASPLEIPQEYQKQDLNYLEVFRKCKNIPDQVDAVKKIFQLFKDENNVEYLQFVSDLYFDGPLKHPVRNQIAKLLKSSTDADKVELIKTLDVSIKKLGNRMSLEQNSSINNATVTSICGCFESFPDAQIALGQNLPLILSSAYECLLQYRMKLRSEDVSPSAKNEYYLFIHNSVRLILSCVQEFSNSFEGEVMEMNLHKFVQISKEIIQDNDIPMDVKVNCGILSTYAFKIFNNYDEFIRDLSALKGEDKNFCSSGELPLCAGYICTLKEENFTNFPTETKNIITKTMKISYEQSIEPCVILCSSRCLLQFSKTILHFDIKEDERLIVKEMIDSLLDYVFFYLEHHMDSVRHNCRDLLRNLIKFMDKYELNEILYKIFEICNSTETKLPTKCIIISITGSVINMSRILKEYPNLFDEIFTKNLGKDLNVSNCYENLMLSNRKETGFQEWANLWIDFLLDLSCKHQENIDVPERLCTIEILLRKAIKYDNKVAEYIILKPDHNNIPLRVNLSIIWTIRKYGLKIDAFRDEEILKKFLSNLDRAILSDDDDLKITALRILVETHKTTELITEDECKKLLSFIGINSNSQSPSTREKMLALLMKCLTRLNLNFQRISKDIDVKKHFYWNFLNDLIRLLFRNFFPTANFSRRSVSLHLLKSCIEIIVNNSNLHVEDFLSEKDYNKIFLVLSDSYEINKKLGIEILQLIETKLGRKLFKNISPKTIRELIESVKPTDSVIGACYLEYLCFNMSQAEAENSFGISCEIEICPVYYIALQWCMNILEDGLEIAKKSILMAAKWNPLYGVLFVIRHLLMKLDFYKISPILAWRDFVSVLITKCKILTEVVGPIVNSSSPEGHLPNDFSELPENSEENHMNSGEVCKILSLKHERIDLHHIKTTPQMVLLCAWRTVKEISLILGELTLISPVQISIESTGGNGDCKNLRNFLLTGDQIINIGNHFKTLLSETKHRGAFEQAYVGFSKLCTRLWRINDTFLQKLPMNWLKELIQLISSDEKVNEKICATRRSAGVPFMVQALITSELQIGTSKALNFCMKHLLRLCHSNENPEAKTHALNILRALFRCTDLNEAVAEYVAEGVKCSISGYNSSTWAERNSSTLLFSALITRIFGVQRTKSTEILNIRNRMTGRIFFLRYPKLYDFFLSELKEASEKILMNEKAAKLHPLLLILNRLYPSALEGTESNLKLSTFVPFISKCSGSPEMQTRNLAAKAIVVLLTIDVIENRILEVLTLLKEECINSNYQHGYLLQLLHLLTFGENTLSVKILGEILLTLLEIQCNMKPNAVLFKVYFDIIIRVLRRFKSDKLPSSEFERKLKSLLTNSMFYTESFYFYYPVFSKSFCLCLMQFFVIFQDDENLLELFLKSLSNGIPYEHVETALNIILLVLFKNSPESLNIFEITKEEIAFVDSLDENNLSEINDLVRWDKFRIQLENITTEKRFYPECTVKAYAIMSKCLKSFQPNLKELIAKTNKYHGDVATSITMCIETYLEINKNLTEEEINLCLDYNLRISEPWNHPDLRLRSAKLITLLNSYFQLAIDKIDVKFCSNFVNVLLTLLMDDDSEIRSVISGLILRESGECCYESINALYAQELLFLMIAQKFINFGDEDLMKFIRNIFDYQLLSNVESTRNGKPNEADLEVFDKNEANVYAEPYKVIEELINAFCEFFKDHEAVQKYLENINLELENYE